MGTRQQAVLRLASPARVLELLPATSEFMSRSLFVLSLMIYFFYFLSARHRLILLMPDRPTGAAKRNPERSSRAFALVSSRRFSSTCYVDSDGQPTCDSCPPGYTGRRCERYVRSQCSTLCNLFVFSRLLPVLDFWPPLFVCGSEAVPGSEVSRGWQ